MAHIRPPRDCDAVADRKAVEELVDEHVVGPAISLGGIAKRGQAARPPAAKGCFTAEVAGPQGGRKQILAAETGLEDQLKVVVEGGGAEALVVLIDQFIIRA